MRFLKFLKGATFYKVKHSLTNQILFLVVIFLAVFGISATVVVTQTNIFPDSGNVGIGTITPETSLHLEGDATLNGTTKINYLYPNLGNGNPYRYLRIGDPSNTWAGIMMNTSSANYGNGNDVSLFTYGNRDLTFRTGTGNFVVFPSSGGNMGIGTTSPAEKLHINGSVRGNAGGALRISTGNGYVDIGPKNQHYSHFYTNRPRYYFNKEIVVDSGKLSSYNESLRLSSKAWSMFFDVNTDNVGSDYFQWRAKNQNIMRLSSDGNLCIGCDNATNRLDINGTARAKEIIVENAWADYVFAPEYKCPTLEEEAKSIEANGHLLGFQSEAEMNGEINIGAATKAQQVKIEELMLHMIEKDRQIERLEELVERTIQIGPK